MRIGLISDTHDLLRPQAIDFLRGSDHILHAGDICGPAVLAALGELAPLTAVRGNNDRGGWANAWTNASANAGADTGADAGSDGLHEIEVLQLGGVRILLLHDLAQFDPAAAPADLRVVVSGHSHQPLVVQRGNVLHVNPGSAGPRRFRLPISVGELTIEDGTVSARTVELSTG